MDKTVLREVFGPDREVGIERSCKNLVAGQTTVGWKTLNKIRP
ncbi:MAG: hypothetical protein [Olavius algarvensis Delta 4 endosymbiont]|nr:MAG: hypothetical protein [Olavius algarvensis Delta 4 endosymbiont]